MMKKYKYVLFDGLSLIIVSCAIVFVLDRLVFTKLKKNSGGDSLVTVILQDNSDRVKELLEQEEYEKMKEGKPATLADYKKMRANKSDEFGRTPLMWVAYANNKHMKITAETDQKRLPMVETLYGAGADINGVDGHGWTPLMWGSWSGMSAVVIKLLTLGADFNKADQRGNTALMVAAQSARPDVVKLLVEKGADKLAKNVEQKTAKDLAVEFMAKFPHKEKLYQEVLGLL